ncbi:alpha/beta fold hydrolase [Streptomyces sp. NPDC058773]|uniref:alpha/beta fold hydrolase n=1 Tax=Streptomyces sp. NPDC058773 TaxID=3346632 RepID=UPI00369B35F2
MAARLAPDWRVIAPDQRGHGDSDRAADYSREGYLADLEALTPFASGRTGPWGLHFHPKDIYESEDRVHGDHWADWTGSACPALLIRGTKGGVLSAEQAAQMAARRPGTRLVELGTDHFLYANDPVGFTDAVRDFLASV